MQMARYLRTSIYLRNGQMWRKSGRAILDELRMRRAAEAQEAATEREREAKEAQEALDALRADVQAAKARKTARLFA